MRKLLLLALMALGGCTMISSDTSTDNASAEVTSDSAAKNNAAKNNAANKTNDQFLPAVPMQSVVLPAGAVLDRVAFGSCFHPSLPGGIFSEISSQQADAFVLLGDNVYAKDESDDPSLASLRHAYADLAQVKSFESLRNTTPVIVTWDDHDYGKDDAGGEFVYQAFSEALYEYAWAIEPTDDRARRPGVYHELTVGPPGRRVQFILLDTRFFRTPMTRHPDQNIGRYVQSQDPDQNLLGDAQWQWLEEQLKKPADLRFLVSPIQVIADGHYWESWHMMPLERDRLYKLLADTRAEGVVIISGDRHSAAMYELTSFEPYPLYELSTSSLNVPLTSFVKNPVDEPGPHRLIRPYYESNYGLVDIDWDARQLTLKLMDEHSQLIAAQLVSLDGLRP